MNIHRSIRTLLIIGMAAGFGPAFARAGDDAALGFGALRGVTLNAAGQPVAMVSVAIHSMDGSTDRKVVSDGDGVFAADHLKSGPYQITAAKEGLISPPATTVEVAQDQTARPRLVLAAVDTAPVATLGSPAELERELEAMKDRIAVLEAALKARIAAESASPPAASSASTTGTSSGGGDTGSAAGAGLHSGSGQFHAVRVRRFYLAQRQPAQQRYRARYEILHPGSPLRYQLHGGFQPAEGSHDRGGDRVIPLRRSPDRADQCRRRFPLAKRSRQNSDHVRHVCHHDAAQ